MNLEFIENGEEKGEQQEQVKMKKKISNGQNSHFIIQQYGLTEKTNGVTKKSYSENM